MATNRFPEELCCKADKCRKYSGKPGIQMRHNQRLKFMLATGVVALASLAFAPVGHAQKTPCPQLVQQAKAEITALRADYNSRHKALTQCYYKRIQATKDPALRAAITKEQSTQVNALFRLHSVSDKELIIARNKFSAPIYACTDPAALLALDSSFEKFQIGATELACR